MIDNIMFDKNVPDDERLETIKIFNRAYNDGIDDSMPWGYVYRSIYADGHTYVGKRKIYPHTDWMDYVGSGANLNTEKVIRKEFICFGWTNTETHELECKYIQNEIHNASSRDMVLNIKVNVVDSTEYQVDSYEEMVNTYGMMILDVYLAYGSDRGAAEWLNCSKKNVDKFLHENGILKYGKLVNYIKSKSKNENEKSSNKSVYDKKKKYKNNTKQNRHTNNSYILYKKYSSVICHEYKDGKHYYGIVCNSCGNIFDSNNAKNRYCSSVCRHENQRIIKKSEKENIDRMLKQGMSLRSIGKHYNTSAAVVIHFMEKEGLHTYESNASKGLADTATYKETGAFKMHIYWHVRRNKHNMNCVYCQRHEGFDSPEAVKADERIHICANPRCGRQFKSQRDKYCSDECHDIMKSYANMFSSHRAMHVNKHKTGTYCWFCEHGIMDSDDYANVNVLEMMDGCDSVIGRRNDCIMRLYESNVSIREINRRTGIARDTISAAIKAREMDQMACPQE